MKHLRINWNTETKIWQLVNLEQVLLTFKDDDDSKNYLQAVRVMKYMKENN